MSTRPNDVSSFEVDLTNCDREPIHIPGAVQPFSALLASRAGELGITHASENVAEILGRAAKDVLGRELDEVLSREVMHEIGNAELGSDDPSRPGLLFGLQLPSNRTDRFDAVVHQYDDSRIIELQLDDSKRSALGNATPMALVNTLVTMLHEARTPEDLLNTAAASVRRLLGFDRVMVYRFEEDDSGQVVAESKRWNIDSFLGLRYPASDIPKQARELYRRNATRLIADVGAPTAPILAHPSAAHRPLDLSYSSGRAVSPIHIEYLQNMGVQASMSISILVAGRLWGLIACHHYSPKVVSLRIRSAAQLFVQFLSVRLEAAERAESFDALHAARDRIDAVVRSIPEEGTVFESLASQIDRLGQIVRSDGVILIVDGEMESRGEAPDESFLSDLAQFLTGSAGGQIFETHALSAAYPPAADYKELASGVLSIPFGGEASNFILFLRKELPETVTWAGNPNKPVEQDGQDVRLTPRKSFEVWKEERRGYAKPWSAADKLLAETLRVSLLEVTLDARETAVAERRKNEERQKVLISELNHRVKNILALMGALISRGREAEGTIEEYVRTLEGRIRALAFAHDHITRNSLASFRALLESEAAPFLDESHTLDLDGPPLTLDSRSFPIVALVIHELMTNAAKYGALAAENGRLEVRWTHDPEKGLDVSWRESGGPAVREPQRKGFGSVLIERNIPFELGGKAVVRYAREGLEADFTIPPAHVNPTEEKVLQKPSRTVLDAGLEDYQILVVEDQLMIALNTQKMLENLGAGRVETAATTADALEMLDALDRPVAVLDVNLGSETSVELANELRQRGIPFVFATGYSDSIMIPDDFGDVPVVRKPYTANELRDALLDVIEETKRR